MISRTSFLRRISLMLVIGAAVLIFIFEKNLHNDGLSPKKQGELINMGDPFKAIGDHTIDDMFRSISGDWVSKKKETRLVFRDREVFFTISGDENLDFGTLNRRKFSLSDSLSFDFDGRHFDFYWVWDAQDTMTLITNKTTTDELISIEFIKEPDQGVSH